MYSNYQRIKNGLLSKNYNKCDVIIEQQKINKIKSNFKNLDFKLKRRAAKRIKQHKLNIEFVCRMLNQQTIEAY